MRVLALTSLSPSPEVQAIQTKCLQSWRAAGLSPVALNHSDEIASLRQRYDAEFVPVQGTTEAIFGKPFVRIKSMIDFAGSRDAAVLILNSDICLDIQPGDVERLAVMLGSGDGDGDGGGLCYFVRHNLDGAARPMLEPAGIDAFLLHGRNAGLFQDSFLSMGQPWWDYWLPCTFISAGRKVFSVESPVAFHEKHPIRWSQKHWEQCQYEFARLTGTGNRLPHAPSVRKYIGDQSVPMA